MAQSNLKHRYQKEMELRNGGIKTSSPIGSSGDTNNRSSSGDDKVNKKD